MKKEEDSCSWSSRREWRFNQEQERYPLWNLFLSCLWSKSTLQINSFWNLGFLLAITIILQIITGIFLGLHYTSDLHSAYSSVFFFIREIYYGWSLRYLHSSGASFVFLFVFLHLGRAIFYGSYFYNPNTWFSGIILLFFFFIILLTSIFILFFFGEIIDIKLKNFWNSFIL